MLSRREFLKRSILLAGMSVFTPRDLEKVFAQEADPIRLVVLSDSHLPVREQIHKTPEAQQIVMELKKKVMEDISSWDNVNRVMLTGDVTARYGLHSEMTYAQQYFGQLKVPFRPIPGNHDINHSDKFNEVGKNIKNDAIGRRQQLEKFKAAWGLESVSRTEKVGKYRMIYLAPESDNLSVGLGEAQMVWLSEVLEKYKEEPTIIWFHAPLYGTLPMTVPKAGKLKRYAQPIDSLEAILDANPQVFIWMSGHIHLKASHPAYADKEANLYKGRIMDINTGTMDEPKCWSNSLYLYEDRVEIKTYNHHESKWESHLDRTVLCPKL